MRQPKVGDKVKWYGTRKTHSGRATLNGTVVESERWHGVISTKRGTVLVTWEECEPA